MKKMLVQRRYMLAFLLLASALLLAACSSAPEPEVLVLTVSPTQASMAATPSLTPSATAAPSPPIKPSSTPRPSATPTPSMKPTPSAKPTPGGDETVVAEGFSYKPLDKALQERITGISYPASDKGSKIKYADLRYIRLKYYDFDGKVHDGELIVHKKLAKEVTEIFHALYKAKYAFTSIRLVDDYNEPGDDNKSMSANNTSAFNYRHVSGSKTLSMHSYGAAIDINPRLNPYIRGEHVSPKNGADYADRSRNFPGKIDHDDLCYKLFTKYGWSWGGDWKGDKDYQHFSNKL